MRFMKVGAVLSALVVASASAAQAQACTVPGGCIYNNGIPQTGFFSPAPDMVSSIVLDNFTLSGASAISSINFWAYSSTATKSDISSSFYWEILSSVSGHPGAVVASGTAVSAPTDYSPGTLFGTIPQYFFSLAVTTPVLAAGTQYYLGLHDGPLSSTTASSVFWSPSMFPGGNGYYEVLNGGNTFQQNSVDYAFYLNGSQATGTPLAVTPEPATMSLMATGLIAMVGVSKRRRRK